MGERTVVRRRAAAVRRARVPGEVRFRDAATVDGVPAIGKTHVGVGAPLCSPQRAFDDRIALVRMLLKSRPCRHSYVQSDRASIRRWWSCRPEAIEPSRRLAGFDLLFPSLKKTV